MRDNLNFVNALIGHLAWPIVTLAIAVLFRHQIGRVIDDASEIDVAGMKYVRKWQSQTKSVAERLANANPDVGSDDRPSPNSPSPPWSSPTFSPYGAIHSSYERLIEQLRAILGDNQSPEADTDDARSLASMAEARGLLSPSVVETIGGVQVLHDLAMSDTRDATPEQARQFSAYVDGVLHLLRSGRLA